MSTVIVIWGDFLDFYIIFVILSVLQCITTHLGTLVVLQDSSRVLPRSQMKPLSVPDYPMKRFEKILKNRKIIIFGAFSWFSLVLGIWRLALHGRSCDGCKQLSALGHSVSAAPADFGEKYNKALPGHAPSSVLGRLPGRTRPQRPAAAPWGKTTFLHYD